MNYLGHAWASGSSATLLTGNMIGDFVKGKKDLESYPPAIQKGVKLHRFIDSFADAHPSHIKARSIFRQDYGLYAGAIIDSLLDYFIANDPGLFPSDAALFGFSQSVYLHMSQHQQYFPDGYLPFFESMRKHNWLYNYRVKEGIQRSLNGLYRRARYMAPPERAFQLFEEQETFLKECYDPFMADFIAAIEQYKATL